ncbi:MAG: M81 family metallopeptidase [Clostridia bacterium]|nr:M81 family metallopeptidase [Clostridia bacterium]
MRIATGGFAHETNGFGNILVTPEVLRGATCEGREDYEKRYRGVRTYGGGFLDEADALGIELIPTRMSSLKPSGPSTREVLEYSRDRLVELLWEEWQKEPFDAIALSMHGAGAAHGCPDLEGEFLRAIRARFGCEIPIGVVLDLHGNISEDMVNLSDLLIGVKNYPHTDEYDAGRIMLRILCDMVENNYRPAKRLVKLPWHLAPAQGVTLSGPAAEVRARLIECEEADSDLLAASFFQGFPFADVPDCGVSVVTMAKTQASADRNAEKIASWAWDHRTDFNLPLHSAKEAMDIALSSDAFPMLINESSDNPGGGTPGDGTHLLREMLSRNVPSAYGFIYDPEVALQATRAGVGAHIAVKLGGKTDKFHGEPIDLPDAYVKCISDGVVMRKSMMGKGAVNHMGPTVCLVVGNVNIVVSSFRTQTFDDGPLRIAGVDWPELKIIALKSSQHFKAWWKDQVAGIISCDSPGIHSSDLSTFNFTQADTGYYPLADAKRSF